MSNNAGLKILIVDDSDAYRSRLARQLSQNPEVESVMEAEDAIQAIIMVGKLRPDVVILDIRMAGNSGIEALRWIKEKKNPPVVIMLTNHPYRQYRERCLKEGADYFFDKSVEFQRVGETITKLGHEIMRSGFKIRKDITA